MGWLAGMVVVLEVDLVEESGGGVREAGVLLGGRARLTEDGAEWSNVRTDWPGFLFRASMSGLGAKGKSRMMRAQVSRVVFVCVCVTALTRAGVPVPARRGEARRRWLLCLGEQLGYRDASMIS